MSGLKQVTVIGGGASGLTAAISAARTGCDVTVIEKGTSPGKKLSMTGNGRCNLSNTETDADCYNASARDFLKRYLGPHSTESVISFLRSAGVLVRDEEGYLYPVSGQAQTVVRALVSEAERSGVKIVCGEQVKEVLPKEDGSFIVRSDKASYPSSRVILASGGRSGPKTTGSTGDGYYIAEKLGMRVSEQYPALVRVLVDDPALPKESGVRMWGKITFIAADPSGEEEIIAEEYGEIQITKDGLSGIPVLQAGGAVGAALKRGFTVRAVIDFFAQIERRRKARTDNKGDDEGRKKVTDALYREFIDDYTAQFGTLPTMGDFLNGICNSFINETVLSRHGMTAGTRTEEATDEEKRKILEDYRALSFAVTGTGSFTEAQATAGGIMVTELTEVLEARSAPGVYVCGELADVDGRCGGYNLHWAFVSGMIAGEAAAGSLR